MPTPDELPAVEAAILRAAGFPGVVGAIDGTLIKIPMPVDTEGWSCRKNYPATNVQAVVDALGAMRSISTMRVLQTISQCETALACESGD